MKQNSFIKKKLRRRKGNDMKIALRAHWWDIWGLCRSPCTNATKNLKRASVLLNKNLCVITEEQKALSSNCVRTERTEKATFQPWTLSSETSTRHSYSTLRLTFPRLLKHSIYPYLLLVTLTHFSFLNCIFRKKM